MQPSVTWLSWPPYAAVDPWLCVPGFHRVCLYRVVLNVGKVHKKKRAWDARLVELEKKENHSAAWQSWSGFTDRRPIALRHQLSLILPFRARYNLIELIAFRQ